MNDLDTQKKLVDINMFNKYSVCRKAKKLLKVVYTILSWIAEAYHTCHKVFKRWLYIEEIIKLCREDKVCWNSVKTEIWGTTGELLSRIFSSFLPPPPFFPPYICSLPPIGNIRALWWKESFSTWVIQESDQAFWGKWSVAFESKSHQVCNSCSSDYAHPSPKIFTEGKFVLSGFYCVQVK